MLPKNAHYYFPQASVQRAMPSANLQRMALEAGLQGEEYPTVEKAVHAAQTSATSEDFIFVGGSCFDV